MSEVEREAWIAFRSVVTNFLRNNKDTDYVTNFCKYAREIQSLGVINELKNAFLNSHLDYLFNLGAVSEEQGEGFHQDIKEMERRYRGRWNVNMMGDYCWMLHREIPETSHKRKSKIRSFAGKKRRHTRPLNKI
jgi:hypothetical protein